MGNLKHCPGCSRDLPRSLFPRRGELCFHCVFNGPGEKEDGEKEDIIPTPVLEVETTIKNDTELVYLKHEEKIIKTIKETPTGVTRKDISHSTGLTVDTLYPLLRKLTDQGEVVMAKEVVDDRLMNVYYPPDLSSSCVGDVDEKNNNKTKSYTEKNQTPGYNDTVKAETITNTLTTNNNNDWGELRNRLIDAAQKSIPTKQHGLIQTLYVMMKMEKEMEEAHL